MENNKLYFWAFVSILFGFGLGAWLPLFYKEPRREPASVAGSGPTGEKETPKKDLHVSKALKECVADRVKDNKLELHKLVVDGRNWTTLSIDCVGDKAKALYEAVSGFSDEQYVRYSDGRGGVGRFFGHLYPPSQCVRLTRNAKGSEMNRYSCSLLLDFDQDMIKSLTL